MTVKLTQTERILARLKMSGSAGMCSVEPIRWAPPILRAASRINDLKNQGHRIEAAKCTKGDHGDAYAVRYVLILKGDQPRLWS